MTGVFQGTSWVH